MDVFSNVYDENLIHYVCEWVCVSVSGCIVDFTIKTSISWLGSSLSLALCVCVCVCVYVCVCVCVFVQVLDGRMQPGGPLIAPLRQDKTSHKQTPITLCLRLGCVCVCVCVWVIYR